MPARVAQVAAALGEPGSRAVRLRLDPPSNPTGVAVECFDDAMSAFQRHATIERMLVDGGWTLESFESKAVER